MVQLAAVHAATSDVNVTSVQIHVVFIEEQSEDGMYAFKQSLY